MRDINNILLLWTVLIKISTRVPPLHWHCNYKLYYFISDGFYYMVLWLHKQRFKPLFFYFQNNVVGYFVQIVQLLTNAGYSYEDMLIVACPTPEQVSVFISSASLISHSEPVLPYGSKAKPGIIRKPSVTSVKEKNEEKTSTDAPVTV